MSKGVTKFGESKVNRARQHLSLCSVYLFTIKATFLNKGELKLSLCELNFQVNNCKYKNNLSQLNTVLNFEN